VGVLPVQVLHPYSCRSTPQAPRYRTPDNTFRQYRTDTRYTLGAVPLHAPMGVPLPGRTGVMLYPVLLGAHRCTLGLTPWSDTPLSYTHRQLGPLTHYSLSSIRLALVSSYWHWGLLPMLTTWYPGIYPCLAGGESGCHACSTGCGYLPCRWLPPYVPCTNTY
jgi:hypothetical protein